MNPERRYLLLLGFFLLAGVMAVGAINLVVDPHRFFNLVSIEGFNAKKPYVTKIRLRKPVHIHARAPSILIMGSSRAGEGLHCQDFTARLDECYNSALRGITTYEQKRVLEHAIVSAQRAGKRVERIVLKLSYATFTETDLTKEGFEDDLFAHEATGADFVLRKAILDKYLYALFSWEALSDSRYTLHYQEKPSGWFSVGVWSLEPDGSWHTYPLERAKADPAWYRKQRMNQWGGAANAMNKGFGQLKKQIDAQTSFEQNFVYLEQLFDLAYRHDIDMDILLPTEHVSYLQLLDEHGLWPYAEDYKRRIVAINEKLATQYQKPAYRVWDFGGVNRYSTEKHWGDLPSGDVMHNYVDIVHFSSALGALMLEVIRDNKMNGDWYELVNSNNIESHLHRLRREMDAWLKNGAGK